MRLVIALIGTLLSGWPCCWAEQWASAPNIVVILCDDLGYGDVSPLNQESSIATPNFARLASEGLTFTDAHSPSAVCTPTRYGLLCGRYCWRTRLKQGVLGGYSRPLLNPDQQTIATVLSNAGYHTACIGKWHLGLGWQWRDDAPENINNFSVAGRPGSVDYSKPLTDSPTSHGFKWSYIIPASLDMSPYVYIENDRVTSQIESVINGKPFPSFYRKGELGAGFSFVDCLDHLADQAAEYIQQQSAGDKPYFLYVPLPAPHKPVVPSDKFVGKSGLGPYGDFVMQVDGAVGRIADAISRSPDAKNTLLLVTSDNGSFMYRNDDPQATDHVTDSSKQVYRATSHRSNGPFRGTKADIWEAGHRVPFFARWPERITPGGKCDKTFCLVDLLATCAQLANAEYDQARSEDSYSLLPQLLDAKAPSVRPPVIHHSVSGMFAVRKGNWKLVMGNGSGGREKPKGKPFAEPFQLFRVGDDPSESHDVANEYPDVVADLKKEFERIAHGDHSTNPN